MISRNVINHSFQINSFPRSITSHWVAWRTEIVRKECHKVGLVLLLLFGESENSRRAFGEKKGHFGETEVISRIPLMSPGEWAPTHIDNITKYIINFSLELNYIMVEKFN